MTLRRMMVLAATLGGCATEGAGGFDDAAEADELTVTVRIEGRIDAAGAPLGGAYVLGLDAQGRVTGRAVTAANGAYALTSAGRPQQLAVKSWRHVPRYVTRPALAALGSERYRFAPYDVGPALEADGNGELLTFMALRSSTEYRIVPQVAWGSGGSVGSPEEEAADLTVGPRIPQLMSLLPAATRVSPDVEQCVVRRTAGGLPYLDVRYNEALNTYNLGAAQTGLLIDQLTATASHAGGGLPVHVSVRCATCAGGYADLRDGHVGPTGPGRSYRVDVPRPDRAFTDVAGHRFAGHLAMAKGLGVATAYDDGSYRPNEPVTRAAFTVMLVRALGLPRVAPAAPSFTDVRTADWYFSAVETARARGLISGYADRTFRPNGTVSRAELAGFLANAARWPSQSPAAATFTDVPRSYWAFSRVETAYGWCHAVEPRDRFSGAFLPAAAATRAEATAGLMRTLNCLVGLEPR